MYFLGGGGGVLSKIGKPGINIILNVNEFNSQKGKWSRIILKSRTIDLVATGKNIYKKNPASHIIACTHTYEVLALR